MGLKKNNPGCGCCDYEGSCPYCIDGAIERYMTAVIAGMADDTCDDCETIDGTWLLEHSPLYHPASCNWSLPGGRIHGYLCDNIDDDGGLEIILAAENPVVWRISILIHGVQTQTIRFVGPEQGDEVDCMNADGTGDHLLDWDSSSGLSFCDGTSATIELYSGDTT